MTRALSYLVVLFLVTVSIASVPGVASDVSESHINGDTRDDQSRDRVNPKENKKDNLGWMGKIKRIVVLMEENRSFDHFFGYAKALLGVNGLNGDEYNLLNRSNPAAGKVTVDDKSPYLGRCDPDHGTPATASKVSRNMSGFIDWENNIKHTAQKDWCGVMSMFPPPKIPIITTLAQEFAIMDKFFCSHPGPTWPNRMFCLSGTSAGSTETGTWYKNQPGLLFPQPTVMDQVTASNMTWKNYYNDTPWEMFMEGIAHNPHNLADMDTFFNDAAEGTLPNFAWINPRSGINVTTGLGSNDQHPDHDVALGERLMKDVYEALRAGPQWNETLFIITMDEHGGFFDHVIPPNSPAPMDKYSTVSYPDKGYNFTSLGVRIPTILISPWIPKGTVIGEAPQAQKPKNDSQYDLTSIMATTRKLLGMKTGPLTDRDAWAATFEHALSLDVPRTDAPMHLPDAPPPSLDTSDEANLPLNDLQKDIVGVHAHLAGGGGDTRNITKQGHVATWTQAATHAHITRTAEWQESKASGGRQLKCTAHTSTAAVEWVANSSTISTTISTLVVRSPQNSSYCMSAAAVEGAIVGVTVCYPASLSDDVTRKHNRDAEQLWVVHNDASVRPASSPSLCITTQGPETRVGDVTTTVSLEKCVSSVGQHWAYHTNAPGNSSPGMFMYGDDTNFLQIV
eukprot:m.120115 g.120115  ORF g.120115 m.120115 type:complete len:679 (-) comp28788_c0_seq1:129-2165(-)